MSTTPAPHPYSAARAAVAAEVRALMGRHRVSQVTLAGHIGISQPALSRRLLAEHPFDMDELLSIAAFFDVEVTALLVGIEQGGSQSPWITTQPELWDTPEDDQADTFLSAA